MRLVIAEKPSVAQSIAAVRGAKSRHDGYLEGSGYIVSWCFGHLAELADAAVYNADDAKWTLAALPIIPTSFRFIVRSEKQKQFDILRELMRRVWITSSSAAPKSSFGSSAVIMITATASRWMMESLASAYRVFPTRCCATGSETRCFPPTMSCWPT